MKNATGTLPTLATTEITVVGLLALGTPAEVQWAPDYLFDLPTIVKLVVRPVSEFLDEDGKRWRQAGALVVSPYEHKSFHIRHRRA